MFVTGYELTICCWELPMRCAGHCFILRMLFFLQDLDAALQALQVAPVKSKFEHSSVQSDSNSSRAPSVEATPLVSSSSPLMSTSTISLKPVKRLSVPSSSSDNWCVQISHDCSLCFPSVLFPDSTCCVIIVFYLLLVVVRCHFAFGVRVCCARLWI